MTSLGPEVPGLPQPPPISPPLSKDGRRALAALRKAHRAKVADIRGGIQGLRQDIQAAKAGLRAQRQRQAAQRAHARQLGALRRRIRGLQAASKKQLRALRSQNRALRKQVRQLRKANPASVFNRARGAARRGRRTSEFAFLPWVLRKALKAFRQRGSGDGRNHGAKGVRRPGRTGLAGR